MVEHSPQEAIETPSSILPRKTSTYKSPALKIAMSAIMGALVTLSTFYLQIPITGTGGYFNIGEVMIYVAAIIFGPYVGAFAGGIGAAMADLLIPEFAFFAPATLIGKGLEGFIIGFIYRKFKKENQLKHNFLIQILAIIIGGTIMVLTYFIFEYFILQQGPSSFIEIPLNYLQVFLGAVAAIPIANALANRTQLEQFGF